MFSELIRRNSKRNRQENTLYFVTMILPVAAFYIILALDHQDVMIFLKDIENDYAGMNEIWDAWCADIQALPRTCVEAKMYRPDVLVEMTVVAVKP